MADLEPTAGPSATADHRTGSARPPIKWQRTVLRTAAALLAGWIRRAIECLGASPTVLPAAGAGYADDDGEAFTCPVAPPETVPDGTKTR